MIRALLLSVLLMVASPAYAITAEINKADLRALMAGVLLAHKSPRNITDSEIQEALNCADRIIYYHPKWFSPELNKFPPCLDSPYEEVNEDK